MMNSFLRGNEADLENRLSELLLDRRLVICYFGFMGMHLWNFLCVPFLLWKAIDYYLMPCLPTVIFLFVVEQFAPSMLVLFSTCVS